MPRDDRDTLLTARPGPYEAPYQVLRGYDAPPPGPVCTTDRGPVLAVRARAPGLA